MMRKACCMGLLVTVGAAMPAAASKQVESLLYDTHQKVTNLDKSLDGAVRRLDDTTTELLERVNESETRTRELRGLVEQNQGKLDTLEQQLGELTATIYREFNLTTSRGGYTPAPRSDSQRGSSVAIEPPARDDLEELEASTAEPSQAPAPEAAHTAYQEAQKAWLSEDYSTALDLFSDFLVRYPNTELAGNAQYWQGRCYLRLERYNEAVDSLERVRLNYPENDSKVSQAMQSQAVALSRLGRNDEARRLLEEVIREYPGTVSARQAESDLAKLRGN